MLFTILLILAVPIGVHISLTSPMPAPPKEHRKLNDYLSTATISVELYKLFCWIHCGLEILALTLPILSQQYSQSPWIQRTHTAFFETFFLPPSTGKGRIIFFPPLRILCVFTILSGTLIRYFCFRALGRHFTFQVALLDDHTLVTTGPYSVVRHPSYIGGIMMNISTLLWHATPGSWLRQSRFYTKAITWLGIVPTLTSICLLVTIGILRPKKEDEILRKEFGKKWEEWAARVPYRLIPGIY